METNFNFNSQICTTREQSERLLALGLKKETADIRGVEGIEHTPTYAWSLHRLIEMYAERYISCSMNLKDLTYEWIINEIEIHIKEGDFNKEYLANQAEIEEHCKGVLEYLDYIKGEEE